MELLDEFSSGQRCHAETYDIGFHRRHVQCDPGQRCNSTGKHLRVLMIFHQTGTMVTQRIERPRRDDARLTEATPDLLLETTRPSDEVARAGQRRADRCAKGL